MITQKMIDDYAALRNLIDVEAKLVLTMIHDIKPIPGYEFLDVSSFDETDVDFRGEEYWRYGGHESYDYSMPINILYDENARQMFLTARYNEVEKAQRLKMEQEATKQQQREANDRKQYEILKQQFGETK